MDKVIHAFADYLSAGILERHERTERPDATGHFFPGDQGVRRARKIANFFDRVGALVYKRYYPPGSGSIGMMAQSGYIFDEGGKKNLSPMFSVMLLGKHTVHMDYFRGGETQAGMEFGELG
jgi:hypothetical protein